MQIIRNILTLVMFARMLAWPVMGIICVPALFLLRCSHSKSEHKVQKRLIEDFPKGMKAFKEWRMK